MEGPVQSTRRNLSLPQNVPTSGKRTRVPRNAVSEKRLHKFSV